MNDVAIKVIEQRGYAALVEWVADGAVNRSIVPNHLIIDGRCQAEELKRGIPYGVPWSALVELQVTPEAVEQALRNVGIWTAEDLFARPQAAVGALQAVYGVDSAVLMRAARKYKEQQHG